MAQDADSEIVARNVATGAEWRAPRGYHPPLPPPDESTPNVAEVIAAQARLARPAFTADSHFVVFSIEPTKADLNKAKKDKKKPEDMPKNALGIMDVSSGQVARIDRVKNFQVPEDGSGFIAYLLEAKPATGSSDGSRGAPNERGTSPTAGSSTSQAEAPTNAEPAQRPQSSARSSNRTPKKEYGADLVLRNLTTGAERTFN